MVSARMAPRSRARPHISPHESRRRPPAPVSAARRSWSTRAPAPHGFRARRNSTEERPSPRRSRDGCASRGCGRAVPTRWRIARSRAGSGRGIARGRSEPGIPPPPRSDGVSSACAQLRSAAASRASIRSPRRSGPRSPRTPVPAGRLPVRRRVREPRLVKHETVDAIGSERLEALLQIRAQAAGLEMAITSSRAAEAHPPPKPREDGRPA